MRPVEKTVKELEKRVSHLEQVVLGALAETMVEAEEDAKTDPLEPLQINAKPDESTNVKEETADN